MKLNLIELDILNNISDKLKNVLIISPYISNLGKYIKDKYKNISTMLLNISDYEQDKNISGYDSVLDISGNQSLSLINQSKFDCVIFLNLEQSPIKPVSILNGIANFIDSGCDIFMSFYNSSYFEYLQVILEPGLYSTDLLFDKFPFYPINLDLVLVMLGYIKAETSYIHGLLDQKYYLSQNTDINFKNLKLINNKESLYNFIPYYIVKSTYKDNFNPNNIVNLEVINASSDKIKRLHTNNTNSYWKNKSHNLFPLSSKHIDPEEINEAKHIAKIITSLEANSILEVGCGYGRIIKEIINISGKYNIEGIDISTNQIENAQSYLNDYKVILTDFDGQNIPYPDDSFDIVFTCGTLSLIPPEKAYKLIQEIYRVSKKYIVHIEDYQINNYRLYNHEYQLIYQRHGIPMINIEKQPYLTKTAYSFQRASLNIDWDFDKLLAYEFYFVANSVEDILNYKNIMRYLPDSQILLTTGNNENFHKMLIIFLEQNKISFTDIFPQSYSQNKIIIVNSNNHPDLNNLVQDKEKYFFVLLFTSLVHVSKRYLDKYNLILTPGKYNFSLIESEYNKEITGLSHLDNVSSNFYNKNEVLNLFGINTTKKILFYKPLNYNYEILEKYIFPLAKEYNIILHFNNLYSIGHNIDNIYNLSHIKTEIIFSISDLLISDNFSILAESIYLDKEAIFINNLQKISNPLIQEISINSYEQLSGKINYILDKKVKVTNIQDFIEYNDDKSSYRIINTIIKHINNI